jgi:uncharacterized membrane protein
MLKKFVSDHSKSVILLAALALGASLALLGRSHRSTIDPEIQAIFWQLYT